MKKYIALKFKQSTERRYLSLVSCRFCTINDFFTNKTTVSDRYKVLHCAYILRIAIKINS